MVNDQDLMEFKELIDHNTYNKINKTKSPNVQKNVNQKKRMLNLQKFLDSDDENQQKQDYIRAYKKNNKNPDSNNKKIKRE